MKMTLKVSTWLVLGVSALLILGCEDYLDKTERADVNDEDVFKDFISFQGFVEIMYSDVVDVTKARRNGPDWNWGDDILPARDPDFVDGNYWRITNGSAHAFYGTNYQRGYSKESSGLAVYYWQNGWAGIRTANQALRRLETFENATAEEKNLLAGQAYFFRGYFHWEMIRAWGNIPYIDKALLPADNMEVPQLANVHETAEKAIADLRKAADLLPADWDETSVGSATLGANDRRITKGAALGILAEALLYCGSPLFNGASTGSYTYNTEYMKRATAVSWELISLANQGYYALEPWANYSDIFYKMDRTMPGGNEVVFVQVNRGDSRWYSQTTQFSTLGGGNWYSSPTQNYVELFEMANGLPITDPASGFDSADPWSNRDPRFGYNILVDGERVVESLNDTRAFVQLFVGGRERNQNNSQTGYGWRKFLGLRANRFDNGWAEPRFVAEVPRIRLAEVYLMYAEAVNEAYGPKGSHPGASLTAEDAVNVVRARANMPDVPAKFTGSVADFRARIWNERAVELAFENKRWYDIRRWYVAHLEEYKNMYGLEFDEGHTYFNKVLLRTKVFDLKHYWLPFPIDQVNMYSGWEQNPGW